VELAVVVVVGVVVGYMFRWGKRGVWGQLTCTHVFIHKYHI